MKIKDIYLDGAANTPIDKRVLKAMKPFLSQRHVGNSFAIHNFGINNMLAIENARSDIARVLKCKSNEVFFTSGASESNNWVIKSISTRQLLKNKSSHNHIICGADEHSSVLNACKEVEKWGMKVTYVHGTGIDNSITLKDVKKCITPETCLICIMSINNETGVTNEINEITKYCKTKISRQRIFSLVDCTQWLSCGGIDMELVHHFPYTDFFSFSAHKIYGPTGVGCLIARKDIQHYLDALITGGAQENGLRGGTSNTAAIVGMAKAVTLMRENNYLSHYIYLYRYLYRSLCDDNNCWTNAFSSHYNIMSLNFGGSCNSDNLAALFATYGIAVSSGSACDTHHNESLGDFNPSHVLVNLGLSEHEIKNTIRLSFTKYTTRKDVDKFIKVAKMIIDSFKGEKND